MGGSNLDGLIENYIVSHFHSHIRSYIAKFIGVRFMHVPYYVSLAKI
jgi:hypothetical protein